MSDPRSGADQRDQTDRAGRPLRHETPTERLDRNWNELLQELRVIQTGVQLLTGFLLTLPFQQRFDVLTPVQRAVFLATAGASVSATLFLQAPVVVHRALFRRHRRAETVRVAHRMALIGMLLLAVAIVGVTYVIGSVVLGPGKGVVGVALAVIMIGALWVALPLVARRRSDVVE